MTMSKTFPFEPQDPHCKMKVLDQVTSVVAQLCPTLCDPVNCSTPGFPVLHHLLELAQTHVH